ncbi:MAG TPA: hypothetical protein VMR45_04475 [Patescibacteria group bacterium]|nr:hypothetical protein [Patescibacteria group bacterium]
MNALKKIRNLKKIVQASLIMALALIVIPNTALAASGSGSSTRLIFVSGTFLTPPHPQSDCPAGSGPDCQIDMLYGDLAGPDQLTTGFINDSQPIWSYLDYTLTTTPYGTFAGEERGLIDSRAGAHNGEFVSYRTSTSTDGCGSTLTLTFHGTIDLTGMTDPNGNPVNPDHGTYAGVLVKKTCQ